MVNSVLDEAIKSLEEGTGIKTEYRNGDDLDGNLTILAEPHPVNFVVGVRKEVRQHQLGSLKELKELYGNFILVAERIYPKLREKLRENEISYLEENGNLFVQEKGLLLLVEGNKPIKKEIITRNRAFTKTGLKIVFHFLCDKELINENQRNIAKTAGVALGNIPMVIDGLKQTGFLLKRGEKFLWQNREDLLMRWIDDYETILRPSLFSARFKSRTDWRQLEIDSEKTHWGGEPGGDLLTNYLRPEEFILFSSESSKELMINYKLIPDPHGEFWVYSKFFNWSGHTAPPILVYADLMLQNDKRCRETAKIIYHEYIEPHI